MVGSGLRGRERETKGDERATARSKAFQRHWPEAGARWLACELQRCQHWNCLDGKG